MVKQRMDLLELLRKRGMDGDVDLLREALRVLVDGIMDAEVSAQIGAQHGERSPERVTCRNGYRNRTWDTRVGTMELHIPKLREGSYFPSLLEPRRRSEKALLAVIQQAYIEGVSTRRVDDLIKALGCDGISSSQVSRICEQLDEVVESFLGRPLDGGPYPYVWLDGLTQQVREGGRIVNVCVVVATGVNADGQREILGMDVGASEDGAFWLAFLRSLTARGLSGVELVTSDAHQGLKNAIAAVFTGASWQRCRTHFMANLLTRVPNLAWPPRTFSHGAHHLPATVSRRGPRPIGPSGGTTPGALCPGGRAAGGCCAGHPGLHGLPGLPGGPLAEAVVQQPAGTAEPRDKAPEPAPERGRGGHFSQPAIGAAPGGRGAGRATRRMGRSPPLDRRQLVLPVATTIFAGRDGVIIRYGGTVDYRPTNQAIEAETYGRQDTGNGSGQGWDERAFSAQVAEWAIAVAGETGASVAHSAGSLRRGVGG